MNWELPFGKGESSRLAAPPPGFVGRWELSPLLSAYSGTPFIVGTDGSSLNAPGNTQVADQLRADVSKPRGVGSGSPCYDPAAFAPVRDVRFGNMG